MNNRLIETARVIALHADDVFALASQPLTDLAEKAGAGLGDDAATQLVFDEMHRLKRTSPLLTNITYLGADGRLLSSTVAENVVGMDFASREYFVFHRNNVSSDIHIGTPSHSQKNDRWFMPISLRIKAFDGQFAGVMVAMIDLDHFARFMESFNLGGQTAFFLMGRDGNTLMRFPFKPRGATGAGLGDAMFFKQHSVSETQGNHDYMTPSGDMERMSGFYRSEETGVTAIATRSKTALFTFWIDRSKYPWIAILTAYIGGLAVAIRWMRQIRLREIGEQKVAAREAEFRLIANASTDVIEKISVEGIREYVSPAAAKIFKQSPDAMIGTSVLDDRDERTRAAWRTALEKVLAGSPSESILFEHLWPDGTKIWLESVLSCVHGETSDEPDGIVVLTRDVTRQQKLNKELDTLATTDELTQLFNKRYFNTQLKAMIETATAEASQLSLILIDLDRFKLFNDTYGHLAGDRCLHDVASVVLSVLGDTPGLAARYGGEELAVLLPSTTAEATRRMAERMRKSVAALAIPHRGNTPWGHVTISIGYATRAADAALSPDKLIAEADAALYRIKTDGRNGIACYTEARALAIAAPATAKAG